MCLSENELEQFIGSGFSTFDRDNRHTAHQIKSKIQSGWWHHFHYPGNVDGHFVQCTYKQRQDMMYWYQWSCQARLQAVEMKVKPFEVLTDDRYVYL